MNTENLNHFSMPDPKKNRWLWKLEKVSNYYKWFGIRGLYFTLQNKLLTAPKLVEVSALGIKHPLFLRLKTSDIEVYGKIFAEREYRFKAIRQPKVIVDAGANIGLASVFFANAFPEATIIAIEPEETNFTLLKKNVAAYPRIIPVQAALWYENALINLIDPGINTEWNKWGFQTQKAGEGNENKVCHQIQGMTVDKIMRDQGIDFIDVLKVDIEGAEKEVFADASHWIDKVGALIIELHENWKPGCSRNFYKATNGFPIEWTQGENYFVAREGFLTKSPSS
jgi:FkbM family methyltransferase